ncbi:hypothetical protein K2Z84_11120, partial [Candidatus Binatia bacterium]|nr:hypothetical protein [Candidatus Binatia bacterium]
MHQIENRGLWQPQRVACRGFVAGWTLNEMIREVAASHADSMRVVDLAGHVAGRAASEFDPALRDDGVQFTVAGAHDAVGGWFGE